MITWFTRHPIAANLLMVALLVGGIFSANNMRREVMPKLPASEISISAFYDGRNAQQIDIEITQKIEQSLQGIAGIQNIRSSSSQSNAYVTIKKHLDYPMQVLLDDIKSAVDNIYGWPEFAEKPQVQRQEDSFDALMVQLSGDTDKDSLIKVGKQLKQALLANPEIHKIQEHGANYYAISINVNPHKVHELGLTFAQIAHAIRQQSTRNKNGLLKTKNGQFLLYSSHQATYQRELSTLVIKSFANGQKIYLKDVATIDDGFVEHDSELRFNNQLSSAFVIKMSAKSDVLAISKQAHLVVEQFNKTLPDNLHITIWFDASQYVEERLDLLQNSALQGFILVFIILSLFLQMRLALWVALGLPIAIAGTFIVLGPLGFQYTINEITTFGFILVLGILVDDAVIVGESIYAHKQQNTNALQATIEGAKKVALPTIFGVLTTVAALFPMTFFPSETGRLFAGFAWVMIIALLFSLLESKLILPSHLRHIVMPQQTTGSHLSPLQRLRRLPQTLLNAFNHHIYSRLLTLSLRYRYAWLTCFIALSLSVLGALYQGKIRSVLFPDVPGDLIIFTVELENNAPLSLIKQAQHKIEKVRDKINRDHQSKYAIKGNVIDKSLLVMDEQGSITVFAQPLDRQDRPATNLKSIADAWRAPINLLEGVKSSEIMISLSGSGENTTSIILQHPNKALLKKISQQAKQWLKQQVAITNINEQQARQMPQLAFTLKPQAQTLGLTNKMLADQLAAAYGGLEVDRFYRDNHNIRVTLQLDRALRDSRSDFSQMMIFNDQGESFPLLAVADITPRYINNAIQRVNGLLSKSLLIEIDKSITSPELLYQRFEQQFVQNIQASYPQFNSKRSGQLAEAQNTNDGLITAFIIALLAIYILLALPLKRYAQPLIIMAAIPFGVVGAIIGHLTLDLSVSLYSWLGMLALSGVVVNDSLLIVNAYNQQRLKNTIQNKNIISDLCIACQDRFRAIFLTTITTFAGLYPLLSANSEQAQYLIPAAASMAYGLLFATLISLFLIPILLVISDDIKGFLTKPIMNNASLGQLNIQGVNNIE
ncbi:MAG: efflux RND transporter permease subunit [Psychromonas sp.]|nr:efflux RND transporter permease subunit [Psychromonas sp.]